MSRNGGTLVQLQNGYSERTTVLTESLRFGLQRPAHKAAVIIKLFTMNR